MEVSVHRYRKQTHHLDHKYKRTECLQRSRARIAFYLVDCALRAGYKLTAQFYESTLRFY